MEETSLTEVYQLPETALTDKVTVVNGGSHPDNAHSGKGGNSVHGNHVKDNDYDAENKGNNSTLALSHSVHSLGKIPVLVAPRISSQHPQSLFINFDQDEERVYKAYLRRQRLGALPVLVVICLAHAITCVTLDLAPYVQESRLDRIVTIAAAAFVVTSTSLLVLYSPLKARVSESLAILMWFILTFQIYFDVGTAYPRHTPPDRIGWLLLLIYFTQWALPLGAWLSLPVGVLLCFLHSVVVGVLWYNEGPVTTKLENQLAGNVMLCLAATSLSFAVTVFVERLNRRSVMETKSALTAKAKIELAYKDKVNLECFDFQLGCPSENVDM
ncbi:adenylate cyclase type 3 [Aplysia californica]|uniref:Adenylate cyclase type 3 n=1 Tax=Aplysia californica TaxID=6500 RepID=A0ABM1A9K8_APLCA|nr:adenylate cyclase type 3 [Aplysia californica]